MSIFIYVYRDICCSAFTQNKQNNQNNHNKSSQISTNNQQTINITNYLLTFYVNISSVTIASSLFFLVLFKTKRIKEKRVEDPNAVKRTDPHPFGST